MTGAPHSDRGMTLVELVVAMAVFALVATMSLQAMTGSLRQRDRLAEAAEQATALATTLALLRSDLDHMAPALFHPPGVADPPESAFMASANGGSLAFSMLRAGPTEATPAGQVMRVEWQHDPDTGFLMRRVWPTMHPGVPQSAGAWVPMLGRLTELRLETLDASQQWQAGDGRPQGLVGYTESLPRAMRVTLDLADLDTVDILVVRP